jgi:hypothetical protein
MAEKQSVANIAVGDRENSERQRRVFILSDICDAAGRTMMPARVPSSSARLARE